MSDRNVQLRGKSTVGDLAEKAPPGEADTTVPAGVLREMCEPPEHADSVLFYAFTLTADHDGRILFDFQSIWAGYADADRKIELREARVVDLRMGEVWRSLGQPFVFVKQAGHLAVYLRTGGHALVLSSIAEAIVPDMLKPDATCQLGEAGFMAKTLVNDAAFKRAPTPKLRMEVLRRDRRRCRICGRNPDDDTDIVLNVHHIRPWAMRGLAAHFDRLVDESGGERLGAPIRRHRIVRTLNGEALEVQQGLRARATGRHLIHETIFEDQPFEFGIALD
ncbi:hypothetical protein [Sphingopyxis sp. Root1497]|uniref:hypothetical protein n=1 Tax=Sphingopyxis sp. Root1497 TaxID=1736474 RepID=UPI000ACC95CD|nr:hypothetical protein [Sphingopyxis sp. Root1497]